MRQSVKFENLTLYLKTLKFLSNFRYTNGIVIMILKIVLLDNLKFL